MEKDSYLKKVIPSIQRYGVCNWWDELPSEGTVFALTVKGKEIAVMTRILKASQQCFGVMKPLQDTNDCLISATVLNFFGYSSVVREASHRKKSKKTILSSM